MVATRAPTDLLTVVLADYFQVAATRRTVGSARWYRFETRLERSALRVLDLLDEFGAKATFFVLGWVGEQLPEVVRTVVDRGHEIASMGYFHRGVREVTQGEFELDARRSREVLERACGHRVLGYRVAHGWLHEDDTWVLDVLADNGFAYDSSVRPLFRTFARDDCHRVPYRHRHGQCEIWELPISSAKVAGWCLPIGGGNYLRQLPRPLMKRAAAGWHRTHKAPFQLYFHAWELDPDQPRIDASSLLEGIRHYRNLDKMLPILREYLEMYSFVGIADYLGLELEPTEPSTVRVPDPDPVSLSAADSRSSHGPDRRASVTIVIPCYNEKRVLPSTLR